MHLKQQRRRICNIHRTSKASRRSNKMNRFNAERRHLNLVVFLLAMAMHLRTCFPLISSSSVPKSRCPTRSHSSITKETFLLLPFSMLKAKNDEDDGADKDDWISAEISEVIQNDFDHEEEEEWLSDREKARQKREKAEQSQPRYYESATKKPSRPQAASAVATDLDASPAKRTSETKASAYTDEEEEVIQSMGGKTKKSSNRREPGFLGDSTLEEIATDYSVPVCYLADVLCTWGVPVPINVHDRLGDLITGEQAFAVLEAVSSLDVAALHDRYSNQSLMNLCADWDIDLNEAFAMAMKEGWSLPFGVHTVLRVEQEDEVVRMLGHIGS